MLTTAVGAIPQVNIFSLIAYMRVFTLEANLTKGSLVPATSASTLRRKDNSCRS